jgi:hypothetical protein
MPPPDVRNAEQFGPEGDLYLVVGDTTYACDLDEKGNRKSGKRKIDKEPAVFHVSSSMLSAASSVMKHMLFGNTAENLKPTDGKSRGLYLPEDHPDAMRVILNITSFRFDKVPLGKGIKPTTLYELTVMAFKYNMTHILRPWAPAWAESLRCQAGYYLNFPQDLVLWIAWELGDKCLFKDTAKRLAKLGGIIPGGDREICIPEAPKPASVQFRAPPGAMGKWFSLVRILLSLICIMFIVLEMIKAHRIRIIESALEPVKDGLNKLSQDQHSSDRNFGCQKRPALNTRKDNAGVICSAPLFKA